MLGVCCFSSHFLDPLHKRYEGQMELESRVDYVGSASDFEGAYKSKPWSDLGRETSRKDY